MLAAALRARRLSRPGTAYDPEATRVGRVRVVVDPSPSRPPSLRPQQYPLPLVVTAQVCAIPASIVAKVRPPATATGFDRSVVEPFPS
jgi:hypothetical protein